MGRPPAIPSETKTRVVLSVLAGEVTIAEAGRREKISEQSIGRWKADFLEAGKTALASGKSGPSTRGQQLEAEVAELTQALGEAPVDRHARADVAPLAKRRQRGGAPSGRFLPAGRKPMWGHLQPARGSSDTPGAGAPRRARSSAPPVSSPSRRRYGTKSGHMSWKRWPTPSNAARRARFGSPGTGLATRSHQRHPKATAR